MGDTPYWQPVQECSVVGANHGRAPCPSRQSEEVEAFSKSLILCFGDVKKAAAASDSYQIAVVYRSPGWKFPPPLCKGSAPHWPLCYRLS